MPASKTISMTYQSESGVIERKTNAAINLGVIGVYTLQCLAKPVNKMTILNWRHLSQVASPKLWYTADQNEVNEWYCEPKEVLV